MDQAQVVAWMNFAGECERVMGGEWVMSGRMGVLAAYSFPYPFITTETMSFYLEIQNLYHCYHLLCITDHRLTEEHNKSIYIFIFYPSITVKNYNIQDFITCSPYQLVYCSFTHSIHLY